MVESEGTRGINFGHNQKSLSAATVPPDHQLPPAPRRRRWVFWLVIVLLLLLAFFLYRRFRRPAPPPAPPAPIAITTATATKGDLGVYLDSIGTVTAVYTASLISQVTGVVTSVAYREGALVHQGDILVQIDPRVYQAQLDEAQGTLERDTNLLAQAQMDLDRYRAAWARNSIAKQTLDDQEKLVLQDQGTVKNDQGTVRYDTVELGYCTITAPFTGRVGLRLIDPGNLAQASSATPLVVLAQVQPITVVFPLAEDDLPQVLPPFRQGTSLTVDALDRTQQKQIAAGHLLSIDNQIDTTTGTVKLRAQFANANGALFPNQFVNTRLLVKTLRGVTRIPAAAIQYNGQAAYVFLIVNGAAQMRSIKAGVTDGGLTQATGLNPGDVVATSSFDRLQNGVKVTPTSTPAPTPATPNTS